MFCEQCLIKAVLPCATLCMVSDDDTLRSCRKVYIGLAQQLMIGEVKSEEAWHARFEAGLASWRMLRTQHAVRLFNDRLANELAAPEPCLAIYRELSQDQASAYQVSSFIPVLGVTCSTIYIVRKICMYKVHTIDYIYAVKCVEYECRCVECRYVHYLYMLSAFGYITHVLRRILSYEACLRLVVLMFAMTWLVPKA